MSTVWVREFKNGLDARRLPETTMGGALIRGRDGHINRGGEFEKRAAFVPAHTLPAGTVNLGANANGLYVWGSATEPVGMPSAVTYQRLVNGTATLTRVTSYDLFAGLIYAAGEFSDGTRKHFYDGAVVSDWADGRARATFQVTGASGGTARVFVEGIEATSGAVSWVTSNAATAAAVAANINAHVSIPNYTAVAAGEHVTIVHPTAGVANNGKSVTFTLASGFTVDPPAGIVLAGGLDTTFPEPGDFVKTIGAKVWALAGPYLASSGVQAPTNWTSAVGAGFIDLSQHTSGTENLTALAEYQNAYAIFAERVVPIWGLSSDVGDSAKQQTLRNTGTASPRSVTQFGDADVFYLDESGLRSLRARDSSNAAATSGIGVRVDPLIIAKLRTLTAAERAKVIGLIEPLEGRFWLIMKDEIFVFTYYSEEKISAWTTYTPHYFDESGVRVNFTIDDAVVFNRRVYLRSGNTILTYGGTAGDEMDETEAEAWAPYLDGDAPAVKKAWTGYDAAVKGEWEVSAATNLRDTDTAEIIGRITRTTYNEETQPALGQSTHMSLRFKSTGTGPRVLSAFALHFQSDEAGAD